MGFSLLRWVTNSLCIAIANENLIFCQKDQDPKMGLRFFLSIVDLTDMETHIL